MKKQKKKDHKTTNTDDDHDDDQKIEKTAGNAVFITPWSRPLR